MTVTGKSCQWGEPGAVRCVRMRSERRNERDDMTLRQKMPYEGAVEFFDFNVLGSWVGEGTPAFVQTRPVGS